MNLLGVMLMPPRCTATKNMNDVLLFLHAHHFWSECNQLICLTFRNAATIQRLRFFFLLCLIYSSTSLFLHLQHFMPLVSLNCSPDVHLFLCQAFVPECTEQTQVRRPCREHCVRVLSDCKQDMNTFGITWPVELSCDRSLNTYSTFFFFYVFV